MNSLEITTMIGCPLMCTFCPQDKLLKAYKDPVRVMTVETFTTILNKIPKDTLILFSGYTEPWSNKNCTEFVKIALEQGFKISIYSTLYNISVEDCTKLISVLKVYKNQLKEFWVHLPDRHGNMRGWKPSETYNKVLSMIKNSIPVMFMTMDSESKVDSTIDMKVPPATWYLHTRANNLDVTPLANQDYHRPPEYEFLTECTRNKDYTSNVLLPNGDVTLCCMDYGLKHIIGNLLTMEYSDIFQSAEFNKIKELSNTLGFTTELLCKSCNDAHCKTPWNDEKVYELVKIQNPDILGL